MNAGHRTMRGVLRPVCVLAVATAGLAGQPAMGSALMATRVVTAAAPHQTPLTSLTLTSVGSDGQPANAASSQADVAADGGYAAFQSQAALHATASVPQTGEGEPGVSSVYVRGLVAGTTTLLSDEANGDATAPGISADGRLVSYEQNGDVYLANRQASGSGPYDSKGNLVLRRVTSTPNDLPYEHAMPCPAVLGSSRDRVTPCGPRLSADGSTLAYPAQLTPVSPELSVTATLNDGEGTRRGTVRGGFQPNALTGDMLDFTPFFPGDGFYGNPIGEATVTYTDTGSTPVNFSPEGITITEPPGVAANELFTLSGNSCGDTLDPGDSCSIGVSFDPNTCFERYPNKLRLVSGDLVTHASTPAGQSVLELAGFCAVFEGGVTSKAAQDVQASDASQARCPAPPKGLAVKAMPAIGSDIQGAPLADAGGAEIGRPYLVWTTMQAPSDMDTVNVMFQPANGSDCHIRLVNPASLKLDLADPLPANAPAACFRGEPLLSVSAAPAPPRPDARPSVPSPSPQSPASPGHQSREIRRGPATALPELECTAYMLIDPGSVTPDSALLGVYAPTSNGPDVVPVAYLTEQGVQHVVVARHDASGAGNFAASPSTIASVTSGGTPLPGASQPSVSADGRYLGFAAPVPIGSAGQQVAAGASQVWLHDTDKSGNRSYKPGVTTLVSCLPRLRAGPCTAAPNADSPSLDGDGQQVAFATTAAIRPHSGFPGTGGRGGAPGPVSRDQVYLRSVGAKTTVLISAPPAGTGKLPARTKNRPRQRKPSGAASQPAGGNKASFAPVISEDATTVGYVSLATNLTTTTVTPGTMNLYLRQVTAGSAPSELISATGASLPAGTAAGLPSLDAHGRLATFPAGAALVTGAPAEVTSVYTFERFAQLTAAPTAAGFGTVLIDSGTHTVTVGITNSGPGPGTVTGVSTTGPFGVSARACAKAVLYHGTRCTVTITFTPGKPGNATGELIVTTDDDEEPPVNTGVDTTAAVPAPRLTATPGVASAGEVTEIHGAFFPPRQVVKLTWNPGLGTGLAITSRTGSFSTDVEIFPDDIVGPRTLLANLVFTGPRHAPRHGAATTPSAATTPLATEAFLTQPSSAEPPFSRANAPAP
ncbi:MAG TPA: choice-of-anchor D domain-containing protein [Streptosporangiaceae bacterium]